jgi:DNA-binding MarR family transcriptional regulator
MSAKMSDRELRVWESLHLVTEHLKREVGRDLWNDAALTDTEFTVLAHLRQAPEGVRPSACAQAIGWDSSRLAHQLRRLEKRGLVSKRPDETDGRAAVLVLTEEGRAAYRGAIGPHLRSAQRWFAAGLTESQLTGLAEGLDALRDHLAAMSTGPSDSPTDISADTDTSTYTATETQEQNR